MMGRNFVRLKWVGPIPPSWQRLRQLVAARAAVASGGPAMMVRITPEPFSAMCRATARAVRNWVLVATLADCPSRSIDHGVLVEQQPHRVSPLAPLGHASLIPEGPVLPARI